jgi:hypothetical protein
MRGWQVVNSVPILELFGDEATRQVENHLPEFFVAYFLTTVRRFSDP